MSAPQGFVRRVKDRVAPEPQKTVDFFLETVDLDEEGNEIVVRRDDFHSKRPTEEQIVLMLVRGGSEGSTAADEIGAFFDLLKDVLPAAEYRTLMGRFRDPDDQDVDLDTMQDIMAWLMEQWQDFPTQSPAASSGAQGSSGKRSTGRAPGKGSTRSASR